jgi:tetratricopeptide (TPR) repeat protein
MNTTPSQAIQETPANDAQPPANRPAKWVKWAWLILLAAVAITYLNSFHGVFLLDDISTIDSNTSPVHQLWPIGEMLERLFWQQRPMVNLSLVINYQVNGLDPWGYHLVNLAIHMLATMVLLGLMRRTLQTRRFQSYISPQHAELLALAVAGIWALHPLQAQSVTYIIQRSESMMGLFYLLVLYCGLRSVNSPRPGRWQAAAIVSFCLGMCSKQVMITAPLMMLIFDRVFLSDSFRQAIRRSWPMYLGLLGSMGILAGIVYLYPPGTSAGFGMSNVTWLEYLRTQPGVILHYIYVCLLPVRLCLDLMWPFADNIQTIAIQSALVIALLGLTIWALIRRPAIGFAGVWFFLILAPTSSFMPIRDAAFEHRLYLSLAGILAGVVVGGYVIASRIAKRHNVTPEKFTESFAMVAVGIMVILGLATASRNALYCDPILMWKDVLKTNDKNPRAYVLIAHELSKQGKNDQAIAEYGKALACDADYAEALGGLGNIYVKQGQWEKSLDYNLRAVQRHPTWADQMCDLGIAYLHLDKPDDARQWFQKALQADPGNAIANYDMGNMLMQAGQSGPAIAHFMRCLETAPGYVEAMWQLAMAYKSRSDLPSAIAMLQKVSKIRPNAQVYMELGIALRRVGKANESIEALRNLSPTSASVLYQLGLSYEARNDAQTAIDMFTKANTIKPNAQCYLELGTLWASIGRLDEAIDAFRGALQLDPALAEAQFDLGIALEARGLVSEARQEYEGALKTTKDERMKAQLQARLGKIAATTTSGQSTGASQPATHNTGS